MHACTVTGYAWNGDVYCPGYIGAVVTDAPPDVADMHMGGTPGPVFSTDETDYV